MVSDMEAAARQLLRALRGDRSQVAFSRRLGYRSPVVADWEHGRRWPTLGETLRAAHRAGRDPEAALQAFQPLDPPAWRVEEPEAVHGWLRALQGSATLADLAARSGFSRHQVGRWLAGRARPRLPEALTLVEALTGRASDLVAALVPIAEVPELAAVHQRRRATRRLAFDHPWTAAVLAALETEPGATPVPRVARLLGVDEATVAGALAALERAGVVARRGRRWRVVGPLTVDVRASPQDVAALKQHWTDVARGRLADPGPRDLHSFNLFAVSRADAERVRQLQAAFFREVRALVASSEPSEVVGLLVTQVVLFDAADAATS